MHKSNATCTTEPIRTVTTQRAQRHQHTASNATRAIARLITCIHAYVATWLHGCMASWLHGCMAAWLHTSVNHKSKCPFHKLFIVRDKNSNAQYSTNPPPKCKEKVRSSATALPFNFLIHNSLAFELFKQFRTRQNWHETSLIILSIARNNCINSKR